MAYYSNGGMAMAKAAIYCRVSSDEQAEKGTIEGQVQYAKKYMELHGLEACLAGSSLIQSHHLPKIS